MFVEGIGVVGPGLDGWTACRAVLTGEAAYDPSPVVPRPVTLLPPAERRRAGAAVKLAISAAGEALDHARRDPKTMAMVFTSSSGDGDTVHDILCVLTTERREVSPTRFHNSVHNAPAGYWAVATGSREPSTSLCAYDDSFSAGLLNAAAQVAVDDRPVTLVAYDVPYPEPLQSVRPIVGLFAAAFVLTQRPTARTCARLGIEPGHSDAAETSCAGATLERLRLGVPAARALPLLAALANRQRTTIRLRSDFGTGSEILVEPE